MTEFVRPAWRSPQLWRVIIMIVAFEVVFAVSPDVFIAFLPGEATVEAYYDGTTAFGTLSQFFTFGISAAGFVVLLKLLHGRGFWSLIGPPAAAWQDLKRTIWGVTLVLMVIELLPPWMAAADLEEVRSLGVWLALFPIAMLALLVQVGTEEIFFRGYLQQQFACVSSSRWAWMVLPSLMFGGLHYWNGFGGAEGMIWVIWATMLGLACADLTARTGNLGAAIGLHLVNNAFALLLVGVKDWPASGLALFLYPYEDPESYAMGIEALLAPWAVLQVLIMSLSVLVMWLGARLALRR